MYGYPTGSDLNGNPITFAEVLGHNHKVRYVAQAEDGDGNLLSYQFGVLGGDVTVDRTSQIRRSLSMDVTAYGASGSTYDTTGALQTIADTLLPDDGLDIMAPYGNKIRVWYQISVPGYVNPTDGSTFYSFPVGLFRISSADVGDDGAPKLQITGYDDSKYISKSKLTAPWIVAAGTNYGDAIIALCQNRLPTLQANPHTVTQLAPQIILDPESDPWQAVTDWAAAIGCEVFLDRNGVLTIQDEPDPTEVPPVWTYSDGTLDPNAVLLSVNRGLSDEPGYNGIVLTSESNTLPAPIRIELWDDDPDSPTYALGQYGKVPYFKTSPLIVDYTGGGVMALTELLKVMGGTESLDFAVIPNPAHEPGDVVRVIRPLSKTDSTAVLDSFTVPLDVTSPMTIRTRERRTTLQVSGTLL
jgi:uncharacterized protein DUF5047